jgi:prepilin-type N-terminal cleavage/methylation domain-containing protein/prepilin-type processing-associated H-X9-DG protein
MPMGKFAHMKSYMPVQARGPAAFTLIELLVVIAIIAILAALLTPSLKVARQAGESAACLHHLRQIGNGLRGYINDHDGYTPTYAHNPDGIDRRGGTLPDGVRYRVYRRMWTHTEWFASGANRGGPRYGDGHLGDYLETYEGTLKGVRGCPSVRDGTGRGRYQGADLPARFYHEQSYGVNLDACGFLEERDDRGISTQPRANYLDDIGTREGGVVSAMDFLIFGDTAGSDSAYYQYNDRPPEDNTYHTPTERHAGFFNALFFDGHAQGCTLLEHFTSKHFFYNQIQPQ